MVGRAKDDGVTKAQIDQQTAAQSAPPERDAWDGLDKLLEPIMVPLNRVIMAKAASFIDHAALRDAQKKDRIALLGKLHIAFSERIEATGEHPVEGTYLCEQDIALRYREKIRAGGLFLLPTVVDTLTTDSSGNLIVIVEWALADTDGHYWPAAVRVSGMGNDRLARGQHGPLALPRAMSAAWKEAVCRIAFLARGYDVEDHIVPVDAAQSRPSNERKPREPAMSMKEEDETRARIRAKLADCGNIGALDHLMNHSATVDFLAKASSRTRKAIEDEAKDARLRLDYSRRDDRGGSRRESEGRPDAEVRDEADQRQYNEPDDDIPF